MPFFYKYLHKETISLQNKKNIIVKKEMKEL